LQQLILMQYKNMHHALQDI